MVCAEKYVSTNDWSTQRHLTSFSAQLWSQGCTQPLSKPTTLLEAPPPSVLSRPPETLLPGPVVSAPVTATPPLLRAAADDAVMQVVALPKSNTLDTVLCTSPPIFSPPLFFCPGARSLAALVEAQSPPEQNPFCSPHFHRRYWVLVKKFPAACNIRRTSIAQELRYVRSYMR